MHLWERCQKAKGKMREMGGTELELCYMDRGGLGRRGWGKKLSSRDRTGEKIRIKTRS